MAEKIITFPNTGTIEGNDVRLAICNGLPTIPAYATITDVVFSCNVSCQDGPASKRCYMYGHVTGTEVFRTQTTDGHSSYSYTASLKDQINNNNGVLTYKISGAQELALRGYHVWSITPADWTLTNIKITVTYTVPNFTLTVTAGTGGTVTGGGTYSGGSTATLKATPDNEYYKFKQWSDGNTSNPRTVTVNGNATYTATFTEYGQISTLVNGEGTVTGGGWYEKGSTATLTATPATGYKFDEWTGGLKSNPLTVTVGSGSTTYVASFSKIYYRISTAVSPSGSGTVKGGGEYAHGETATLTATPNSGYKFVKWSDGNTSATRTITVTAAATYTATFEKILVPVYIDTSQCTAVYVDETNKKIYFYGSATHTESNGAFDTVDGWHLQATNVIPTGASIKEVKKIYVGTTLIYPK